MRVFSPGGNSIDVEIKPSGKDDETPRQSSRRKISMPDVIIIRFPQDNEFAKRIFHRELDAGRRVRKLLPDALQKPLAISENGIPVFVFGGWRDYYPSNAIRENWNRVRVGAFFIGEEAYTAAFSFLEGFSQVGPLIDQSILDQKLRHVMEGYLILNPSGRMEFLTTEKLLPIEPNTTPSAQTHRTTISPICLPMRRRIQAPSHPPAGIHNPSPKSRRKPPGS